MLKHAILHHEDMHPTQVEFGMKVTVSDRSAIERQIAEAVKIEREIRKGKKLMNSKGEFNRCEIPRLTVSKSQALKELREEQEETRTLKIKMRAIKKRKKEKNIEEEMRNPTLRRVCLEILNEDNREWL